MAVLLPAHWQTAAVLLGTWWIRRRGGPGRGRGRRAVHLDRLAGRTTPWPAGVAVLSLDPFGKPAEDLPVGVTDYATAVRVHGDAVVPSGRPGRPGRRSGGRRPHRRAGSAGAQGLSAGDRVMSGQVVVHPTELIDHLIAPLVAGPRWCNWPTLIPQHWTAAG